MNIFRYISLLLCALFAAAVVSAAEKSQTIVYIDGAKYYIHTVKKGETVYSLSKLYEVSEQVILSENPQLSDGLKADQSIKIPVTGGVKSQAPDRRLKRRFDMHYIAAGETLYSISRKYEISVETILEDNPEIDPVHLRIGARVLIRKSEKGESSEEQSMNELEQYKDNLNSVSGDDGYAFHLVHAGETLYALSRRFGISEEEIIRINNLTDGLKTGTIIKLPSARSAATPVAETHDEESSSPEADAQPDKSAEILFTAADERHTIDISLLLPLSAAGGRNPYVEFYEGFLLGLEDMKAKGRSVNLTLFDTSHSYDKTAEIVSDPRFRRSKLIVGPVYEDELLPVLQFAESNSVPVVSPLAHIEKTGSSALFCMAPDPSVKYDKLRSLFGEGRHITLISAGSTDKEFEAEILGVLGSRPYATYKYEYVHHTEARNSQSDRGDMTPLLQNGEDNIFVITAAEEIDVDRILAAIASAEAGITSRGQAAPKYTVVGNPRWLRFNNIDRATFFRNRVVMISSYHAKRDSERVRSFDSRFIEAFGSLPSLYAYRGYDTATIFCNGIYNDISYDMEGRRYMPLQTVYRFSKRADGTHVNGEWMRINYNKDFTIKAE